MANGRIYIANIVLFSACLIQYSREFFLIPGGDSIPQDGRLNFTALGNKYGHPVEEYDAVTEDGYVLKLFHIPGDIRRPVLLMHGIIDSADTFIIRGRGSLAIALAERGYDVWLGNSRGSRYSRRHATLNPDVDNAFWDFSFHELGYYDLPALIDFVLNNTAQTSLSAIGHSQGNTIFYVLGSTRPEYNEKIDVLVALSPVCFFVNPNPPIETIITLSPILNQIFVSLGQDELLGDKSISRSLIEAICTQRKIGYTICAHGIFFVVGGSDPDEVEPEFFPVVVGHYPTGTSRKNAHHLSQNAISKSFSQYDYGASKNLDFYNSVSSPLYDLSKVQMKVALLYGGNDGISSVKDVSLLRSSLPNVVEYRMIEHKRFNHLDAVWGRNMNIYLFPHIFTILDKIQNINKEIKAYILLYFIISILYFNIKKKLFI